MQGIAYMTNGNPRIDWSTITVTDVLDANGNPTGQTQTTDNLQDLIAALPPGTQYTLIDESQAEAWWKAHLPLDEVREMFTAQIQKRLDDFARSDGRAYDNMLSLCTYAASTNAVFRAEGQYGVNARDATWAAANAVMAAVLTGQRTLPTWEQLEAELPPLVWPQV